MSLSPLGIQALELKREIKNLSQARDISLSSLSSALPLSLQNESLVDLDGFPRSDVDLFAVRGARNQVSCLSNDLKDINQKIDQALQNLHSLGQEAIAEAIQADRRERELTSSLPSLSSTTKVTKTEINSSISTKSDRQPLQVSLTLWQPVLLWPLQSPGGYSEPVRPCLELGTLQRTTISH
jgi:paraquat-inducible protein B